VNRCLAIARSHSIAGNACNALALINHALEQVTSAVPILSAGSAPDAASSPRSIQVTGRDAQSLRTLLSGELQRSRALVEILGSKTKASSKNPQSASAYQPLATQLSSYPPDGVNLDNIVTYPPKLEPIPVKPLFLDVAWNYIDYPGKAVQASTKDKGRSHEGDSTAAEQEAKPQKRGWFGFGR